MTAGGEIRSLVNSGEAMGAESSDYAHAKVNFKFYMKSVFQVTFPTVCMSIVVLPTAALPMFPRMPSPMPKDVVCQLQRRPRQRRDQVPVLHLDSRFGHKRSTFQYLGKLHWPYKRLGMPRELISTAEFPVW